MKPLLLLSWILVSAMGCKAPIESGFIYFPAKSVAYTPSDAGLDYEEVFLQTEDGVRICVWYLPASEHAPTMLWFHGNAGNIGDRIEHLKVYHDRWRVNQMIVEYRGYGKSEGKVTEEGTYEDGRTAVRYLLTQRGVSSGELIFFGRSLGSAVAVQMAAEFPSAGLILEAPFASIRDMAKIHYPILGHLFPLRIHYDSIGKINRVQAPLLILHGDRDTIVPMKQGRRLFDAANEPKKFFVIKGAGHNDILSRAGDDYHEIVRDFILSSVSLQVEKKE
jgi:fermentation-respiration switch protein FrsA (DUF1100 family)